MREEGEDLAPHRPVVQDSRAVDEKETDLYRHSHAHIKLYKYKTTILMSRHVVTLRYYR